MSEQERPDTAPTDAPADNAAETTETADTDKSGHEDGEAEETE